MEFVVDEYSDGGDRIVTAQGELDLHTAPRFAEVLWPCLVPDASVIADLTAVTFIDSSGIGVIVTGLERVLAVGSRRLCVVAIEERVLKVFGITGLDRMLVVYETLDAAQRDGADRDEPTG